MLDNFSRAAASENKTCINKEWRARWKPCRINLGSFVESSSQSIIAMKPSTLNIQTDIQTVIKCLEAASDHSLD